MMALLSDYYSFTNRSGQVVTLRKLIYGTPTVKTWSQEELNAAKKNRDAVNQAKLDKVLKYNQSLADKGDAYGLLRMGERYRDGEGVEVNLTKARMYLTKAADAGSDTAKNELEQLLVGK